MIGGVATVWHGWTTSKGPGAKGAPERERQKMKNRKEKKEEEVGKKRKEKKRENETFQILRQGVPMSLSR